MALRRRAVCLLPVFAVALSGCEGWLEADHEQLPPVHFIVQLEAVAPLTSTVYAVVHHPDRTLFRAEFPGAEWTELDPLGMRAVEVAVDPFQPKRVYLLASDDPDLVDARDQRYRILRSDDRGDSWHTLLVVHPWRAAYFLRPDPTVPDRLWLGLGGWDDAKLLQRSDDGGKTWVEDSSGLPSTAWLIAFDASDSSLRYVRTHHGWYRSTPSGTYQPLAQHWKRQVVPDPNVRGQAYTYTGEGDLTRFAPDGTWTDLFGLKATVDAEPWSNYVRVLAVDPTRPDRIYVGFDGGGLFASSDGGQTFAPAKAGMGDVRVNSIQVDPTDGNRILVEAIEGTYFSEDGAISWRRLTNKPMPLTRTPF